MRMWEMVSQMHPQVPYQRETFHINICYSLLKAWKHLGELLDNCDEHLSQMN